MAVVSPADNQLAAEVKAQLARGNRAKACEQFEALVSSHQRRASRIAYHYLRNAAEVDEAVQDAFLKAFVHLAVVPRGTALRTVVYENPGQRMPRSDSRPEGGARDGLSRSGQPLEGTTVIQPMTSVSCSSSARLSNPHPRRPC